MSFHSETCFRKESFPELKRCNLARIAGHEEYYGNSTGCVLCGRAPAVPQTTMTLRQRLIKIGHP